MLFGSVTFVAVQVVAVAALADPEILTVQDGAGVVQSNKNYAGNRIFTKPVVPKSPLAATWKVNV